MANAYMPMRSSTILVLFSFLRWSLVQKSLNHLFSDTPFLLQKQLSQPMNNIHPIIVVLDLEIKKHFIREGTLASRSLFLRINPNITLLDPRLYNPPPMRHVLNFLNMVESKYCVPYPETSIPQSSFCLFYITYAPTNPTS